MPLNTQYKVGSNRPVVAVNPNGTVAGFLDL